MREFSNNTNARLPVLFLLDVSSSMNGIVRGDNQHIVRQEHSDGINWNIVTGDNLVTRMDAHGRHKSSIIAGLLAIFLWPVGAHKFYNGSWGWGIIYIVIIVAAFINPNPLLGILWISEFILALIQGIWWLANPVAYHRKHNETTPAPMKW